VFYFETIIRRIIHHGSMPSKQIPAITPIS
jgi:hypothetical protein